MLDDGIGASTESCDSENGARWRAKNLTVNN